MSTSGLRRYLQAPLTWLATHAPARVFVLIGENAPGDPELLRLTDDVILLESPRSATILLVAGSLPEALREATQRIHDQMAHPRRTVWWVKSGTLPDSGHVRRDGVVSDPVMLSETSASGSLVVLVAAIKRAQYELVTGTRESEPNLLPDVDPAPWRGIGPFGQGGTGMTGGVPYGRPLTGRAPDRDGLELDQLPLRVGPFFPGFPAGLVLDVQLQGDVVQAAAVSSEPAVVLAPIFVAALDQPVPIVEIERERARSHLCWLARALGVHGLAALSRRALRLASQLSVGPASISECATELRNITRSIERSGILWWSTRGVGVLRSDAADALGPIARAAGMRDDARIDEPAYCVLDFEPILQRNGDSSARLRQRLAEAAQSLELAGRAQAARAWGAGVVEGPRGRV
ncbi:MAG: hypothetical protein M3Z30_08300, partial [Gemmatimonadota bacterium]|nr:hypothetical protein [Gemmatimonadota bacterium]